MPSEFELITRYFNQPTSHTVLGIGDDGALLQPTAGHSLVVSTDMLVEGTHFVPGVDPASLGWKALAVNLSDMAAMGATPRWAVVAVSLPAADEAWVAQFAHGLYDCARCFGVDIVGGDTTRGPLNITPTVFGEVPIGQALCRDGAKIGDDIWVSGTPGRAALALGEIQGKLRLAPAVRADFQTALMRPVPRVALGQGLRGLAHAAIDVSDGLLADLGHILTRSGVAATLQRDALPLTLFEAAQCDPQLVQQAVWAGGDDYELLFTAPQAAAPAIVALGKTLTLALHKIGTIRAEEDGVAIVGESILLDSQGQVVPVTRRGYDHFAK
jgi:thiamine-monophosphate kinase